MMMMQQEIVAESKFLEGTITKWSTKSDIWSVGAVLHYILTMSLPYENMRPDKPLNEYVNSLIAALQEHLKETLPLQFN